VVAKSKLAHSVHAAGLTYVVTELDEFRDLAIDLFVAALLHDLGTPPFSHVGEHFLQLVTGRDHEEQGVWWLERNAELRAYVRKTGADLGLTCCFIQGCNHPLTHVINTGSFGLDVDTIAGVSDYGRSLQIFPRDIWYSPQELTRWWFSEERSETECATYPNAQRYLTCRARMFDGFIFSLQVQSPAAMLHRAMEMAFETGSLGEDFFALNDARALSQLRTWAGCELCRYLEDGVRFVEVARVEGSTAVGATQAAGVMALPGCDVAILSQMNVTQRALSGELETPHHPYLTQVFVHPRHVGRVLTHFSTYLEECGFAANVEMAISRS